MAYTKTNWKDRVVERPLTFNIQNNPDGTITLIPAEGQIIDPGTPITAANMNKLEKQYEEAAKEFLPYNGALQDVNLNDKTLRNARHYMFSDPDNDGITYGFLASSGNTEINVVNALTGAAIKNIVKYTTDGVVTLTNQSFVHANSNGYQTVASGVVTRVMMLTSKLADIQNEFSNSKFTAKNSGVYLVRAYADWSAVPSTESWLRLYRNGASWGTIVNAKERRPDGLIMIQLNAGDYIELYVEHNNGGTALTLNVAQLQVMKLA